MSQDLSKKEWKTEWDLDYAKRFAQFKPCTKRDYDFGEEVWYKRWNETFGKNNYSPAVILDVLPHYKYQIELADGEIKEVIFENLAPVEDPDEDTS